MLKQSSMLKYLALCTLILFIKVLKGVSYCTIYIY